jgi:DNA replication protein DnaC
MTDAPQVLLAHHLKALKLPTFLREYDKLARQCAAEGTDYPRYLLRLAELELIERERRMIERRIKAAKFPAIKSLDSFDFAALPSLNKALVMELARSEYVERRENVIAVGNSGTGKSHIALGLGLAACQKGLSVGFTTAAALVHELIEARDEKRLLRLQRQLAGHKLLIVDELGYVPLSQTGAWVEARVWGTRIATRCRRLARLGKVGAAAKECSPDARWMLSGLRRRVRKRSAGTNRDKQSPVLRHSNSQTISLAAVCRAHQNATIEKIDAPTSSFGWGLWRGRGCALWGRAVRPYHTRNALDN